MAARRCYSICWFGYPPPGGKRYILWVRWSIVIVFEWWKLHVRFLLLYKITRKMFILDSFRKWFRIAIYVKTGNFQCKLFLQRQVFCTLCTFCIHPFKKMCKKSLPLAGAYVDYFTEQESELPKVVKNRTNMKIPRFSLAD